MVGDARVQTSSYTVEALLRYTDTGSADQIGPFAPNFDRVFKLIVYDEKLFL